MPLHHHIPYKPEPAVRKVNPMPEVVPCSFTGWFLCTNAEGRLERFDRGWVVSFFGGWGDEDIKPCCWKVYPEQQTDEAAIEAIRRRARDYGFTQIGIVGIDRPSDES